MPAFRMSVAAGLLGVSADTLRRWADAGRLPTRHDQSGRRAIEGAALARFAGELATANQRPTARSVMAKSARNRFLGLVTAVTCDGIIAEVEIQAGPHRIVSLMSRQEADELGLEPTRSTGSPTASQSSTPASSADSCTGPGSAIRLQPCRNENAMCSR